MSSITGVGSAALAVMLKSEPLKGMPFISERVIAAAVITDRAFLINLFFMFFSF